MQSIAMQDLINIIIYKLREINFVVKISNGCDLHVFDKIGLVCQVSFCKNDILLAAPANAIYIDYSDLDIDDMTNIIKQARVNR